MSSVSSSRSSRTPPAPVSATSRALVARGITVAYGMRSVLDGLDVTASPGERLGLVGENGVGKSTLLRVLAGVQAPDHGTVTRPAHVTYLGQVPDLPHDGTVREAVDAALAGFRTLEQDMRTLEQAMADGDGRALEPYGDVLDEYERRDGWSADARAARAIAGLGLGDVPDDRALATLSGGQRSRLALALALVAAADLMLLDEPTNHLDMDSREVLEHALDDFPGTILAVSHDRYFINRVCDRVVEMTEGGTTEYLGNYDDYVEKKRRMEAGGAEDALGGRTRTEIEKEKRKERLLKAGQKALEQQVEALEQEIAGAEDELRRLEAQLADPATYQDRALAEEIARAHRALGDKLPALYEQWEEAAEMAAGG